MSELAYSLHLGSDKNRKKISKQNGKHNLSGTTSLPNNAIQNVRQLSKVDKHNYRKYDNEQDLIEIVRGTSSQLDDVKELYLSEFEEARLEYNSKQKRNDRKIENYFENISNNEKKDLACEIIIELGDKTFWDTKDNNYKKKMCNVYSKQVSDLEMLVPNFKVASAIIHYDETSPHMHIVGVPIKEKNKNGMSKQVGKSDVFTKESLIKLQDKMRILCIEEFNQEYNLSYYLKEKQKGRNRDINVKDMDNYSVMKKQLESNKEKLENANNKSKELSSNTNDIKSIINNLKTTPLRKDNYILNEEDKKLIFERADELGVSASTYIVACIRKNRIVNLEGLKSVIRQLYRIGANINQIAIKVNSSNTVSQNDIKKVKDLFTKCFKIIDEFIINNTVEDFEINRTLKEIMKRLSKIEKKLS